MKKILAGVLILMMVLSAGCTQGVNQSYEEKNDEEVVSAFILTNEAKAEEENSQENEENQEEVIVEDINYEPDFRNVKWKMNKDQLKLKETGRFSLEYNNTMVYENVEAGGYESLLYYDFNEEEELYQASYLLTHEYENATSYISDYKDLKEKLTNLYGEPVRDEEVWLNKMWKDRRSEWGMAIRSGHLIYTAIWETEDTLITMYLMGEDFDHSFAVVYRAKEVKELNSSTSEGL
jgi:hypothetical protein